MQHTESTGTSNKFICIDSPTVQLVFTLKAFLALIFFSPVIKANGLHGTVSSVTMTTLNDFHSVVERFILSDTGKY